MNIHFFKLYILPLFLCGVCFIFKPTMIVCYTWADDLICGVTLHWVDGEVLVYFILWLYEDIFIKFHVEKYILKYSDACMKIYI